MEPFFLLMLGGSGIPAAESELIVA